MDINTFRQQGKHLPKFLKDFHDQKDFFKAMQDMYGEEMEERLPGYNWRSNHEFVIDFFLWFCAMHGYGLKKLKSKDVVFKPLDDTLQAMGDKRMQMLAQVLNQGKNPEPSVATEAASSNAAQ